MPSALHQIKRFQRAARMGFLWTGSSRLTVPEKIHWNGRVWTLHVTPEDSLKWVFRDLILDDEYGLEQLRYHPQTILDIGANVGLFSVWARANFPDAHLHAYEPNAGLLNVLSANLKQVQATMFAEGLSGRDGLGSCELHADSVVGRCSFSDTGTVPVVSLRTALARMGGSVDLLKLDCEGEEWSVLDHPDEFSSVGMVRMEYHLVTPDQTVDRLIDTFANMGFVCSHLSPNQGFGLAWFDRK